MNPPIKGLTCARLFAIHFMILYQNALIKLDYNPATDILLVDMPSVTYGIVPEFRRALDIIVENVRAYDVKKLLVDARKSVIDMDPEEYARLVSKFAGDLKATRLVKGARVITANADREKLVKKVVSTTEPGFLFKTFTDCTEAENWLNSKVLVEGLSFH
jgi:hypothetical protein